MADVPNRDELERRLARKLGRLQRPQLARLLELLGNPPRIGNVPESFWTNVGDDFIRDIAPVIEDIFLEQARELMMSQPIGVDWGLVSSRAVDFANTYSFELVRGINNTSRRGVQRAVSSYFERGQTIGELEHSLSNLFGPVRSSMIAQTEITRAAVQGERAIVTELEKQGVRMIPIFETSDDEKVCPICSPWDGKEVTPDKFPPLHVRCRCWLNHELPKVS